MRPLRSFATAAAVLAAGASLAAHEFWVTATAWRARPGDSVVMLANVGDRFPNASSFTTPDRVESVRLIGPGGDRAIAGPYRREKDSLAADVVLPSTPGTYVGVFVIKPRVGEKSGPIFEEHLRHQGLEEIARERAARTETSLAVRERYSRYGKTLIEVGSGGDDTLATRAVGLKIELVPLRNPARLRPGDTLTVRLLFDGRPAANALVGAINEDAKVGPDDWPLKGKTDANGEVTFRLANRGPWLIRAVRMERRNGETGSDAADWETYWASLTFSMSQPRAMQQLQ